MVKVVGHIITGIVTLYIAEQRSVERDSAAKQKETQERYNKCLREINKHESKNLNTNWEKKMATVSPTMEPAVLYKWFVSSKHTTESTASASALWDYYNNPCRDLLETDVPESAETIFGHNGVHMQTLNGLLAVRLGINSRSSDHQEVKESIAIDQLLNYESICALVQQKKNADTILKKALTMKQLYELCTQTTQGSTSCDTYFRK